MISSAESRLMSEGIKGLTACRSRVFAGACRKVRSPLTVKEKVEEMDAR